MNFLDLICCLRANPVLKEYLITTYLNDKLLDSDNTEEWDNELDILRDAMVLRWEIYNDNKTIIVYLIDKDKVFGK